MAQQSGPFGRCGPSPRGKASAAGLIKRGKVWYIHPGIKARSTRKRPAEAGAGPSSRAPADGSGPLHPAQCRGPATVQRPARRYVECRRVGKKPRIDHADGHADRGSREALGGRTLRRVTPQAVPAPQGPRETDTGCVKSVKSVVRWPRSGAEPAAAPWRMCLECRYRLAGSEPRV